MSFFFIRCFIWISTFTVIYLQLGRTSVNPPRLVLEVGGLQLSRHGCLQSWSPPHFKNKSGGFTLARPSCKNILIHQNIVWDVLERRIWLGCVEDTKKHKIFCLRRHLRPSSITWPIHERGFIYVSSSQVTSSLTPRRYRDELDFRKSLMQA